ncbi:PEP/pyruvate-binding domain-containing protein [Clostridium sp. MB40-C1]|uniref:PEP/pyruvate-binding domain-containing protein n=1 Tax=Clostridium sp. MB40-C1 TaxID=3070996 RepID=UPI0027DF5864|nr:PEP/pyruvate-binding domain-containing protein [Clostridium sp. MB40-C1]WMJ81320.1 PEP/pyruvate-binding domain-containing protein [Clostridium sp. MB40-C1]
MYFSTKAETLENISKIIKSSEVLPQIRFNVKEWTDNPSSIIDKMLKNNWEDIELIVRSSAINEDSSTQSLAGHFLSIPNIKGIDNLKEAISKVIASFVDTNEENQIFIQPMLKNVVMSGVVFSKDPNTFGNYIVINYDDITGSTSSVTSGSSNSTKVYYHFKGYSKIKNKNLEKVINLVYELETIFKSDSLDIEFAITENNNIYLLQVRPLCIGNVNENSKATLDNVENSLISEILQNVERKFKELNIRHPYLYGEKTVFGVMPDWNPAEIIGIRPKNLALSLYKEVVTDNIWAYQRDNYGYKNLRSFPLMINLGGSPYIDVRVSFNSFLPATLEKDLSEKLVNYYIDRLIEKPSLHDKVEFQIIFSCYTLDIEERMKSLLDYKFTKEECNKICDSLRNLTNKIIDGKDGLWKKDIKKIEILEERRKSIMDSSLDKVSKIYWLLEDCKRYGTLPFAGLARAGFIAVQMLKSLVNIGVLSEKDYEKFIMDVDTISSKMSEDFQNSSKNDFIKKYGHLRPGTYDILSFRYDETPDKYFDWNFHKTGKLNNSKQFVLSLEQLNRIKELLEKHDLVQDVLGIFHFIKIAIEGREYSKFVFTKSLSDAMSLFKQLGEENGFSVEDCAYADINIIKQLYASSENVKKILKDSILQGKSSYRITKQMILPPLIINEQDIWSFSQPSFEPNFITLKDVIAEVAFADNSKELNNKILFMPSADPGYDWIFSHSISGFVTMYGGMNSHMAIRAGELGIPAVIGAGEVLYNKWKNAKLLCIDCSNKKVEILK